MSDFRISRLDQTLAAARQRLLDARCAAGHWEGRLSSSALSTATAAFALACVDADAHRETIARALEWLAAHQNADGGWGDTVKSRSNLSTTALCWASLAAAPEPSPAISRAAEAAQEHLTKHVGSTEAEALARALIARYGTDRSFSVPILSMLAMAGRLGDGRPAWRHVMQLPFELAACPHQLFKWLRLPVVSYALPALIAIGQSRHANSPTLNPITRALRGLVSSRTLGVLQSVQPQSGGFLEAAPLTSFVVMNLCAVARVRPLDADAQEVIRRGMEFLTSTARPDGSWPIDTNLATWVTSLSVNALAQCGEGVPPLRREGILPSQAEAGAILAGETPAGRKGKMPSPRDTHLNEAAQGQLSRYLAAGQYRVEHPYTHAAPGGWAWTNLSGGVPDGDDTPGALLALWQLGWHDREAAAAGVNWLLGLQNRDGGMPTFCRGWGKLPFDRSSADLTAHSLLAMAAWRSDLPAAMQPRVRRAQRRAMEFLRTVQRPDGSFLPLWFGNEHVTDDANPVYGTSRVLLALADETILREFPASVAMAVRACEYLLAAQNREGAWGGDDAAPASIEETAVAVDALAKALVGCHAGRRMPACSTSHGGKQRPPWHPVLEPLLPQLSQAIARGAAWLIDRTNAGREFEPSPIGLYFAKLWYFEELYPLIFTVSALGRVQRRNLQG